MRRKIIPIIALVLSAISLAAGTILYMSSGLEAVDLTVNDVLSGETVELYVSVSGSDINEGTSEKPIRTLMGAFERIKAFKNEIEERNMVGDEKIASISVYMSGGRYHISEAETIRVDGTYFPTNVSVNVKAVAGEKPIIDGGACVSNWEKVMLNGHPVLMAQLDAGLNGIYSLNVNGENAELANSMSSADFESSNLSKQNQKKHSYIDDAGSLAWEYVNVNDKKQGIKVTSNQHLLSSLVNPTQTQVIWLIEWKEFMIRPDRIEGNVIYSDYWNIIASEIDVVQNAEWFWPAPIHNFYLQNDISLIDRPGEFCYDSASGKLYYYPLEDQTADNIEAYIPLSSKLIDLSTTVKKGFIRDLTFDGITFANSSVDYIDIYGGFAINQAQQFEVGKAQRQGDSVAMIRDEMGAAITLNYCRNISFTNCRFVNLGLTAIKLESGCQNCRIEGCVFSDLGNSAVVISTPGGYALTEASRSVDNSIENCVIRRIGQINLSSPALLTYFSEGTRIVHNDISDCPYTAISMGWGWTRVTDSYANSNVIAFNKIGNYLTRMKDGGAIYTLNTQPHSSIEYNYIYSQRNNYAAVYLDEGTSGYTVENNAVFLNGLIDENGVYLLDEDGDEIDKFYKESENITWLNINDATPYAGTSDSPVRDIKVIGNYFCCANGYGKILSHPDNIIPPVLNDDASHPQWRNVEYKNYAEFFTASQVLEIISMAGLEAEFEHLLFEN